MRRATIRYEPKRLAHWEVIFFPPIHNWWFHAFYEWTDAMKFADDITSDPERAQFWLNQLYPNSIDT